MYIFLLTVIPLCYFLYHEVERKRYAVRGAGFNFFCGSITSVVYCFIGFLAFSAYRLPEFNFKSNFLYFFLTGTVYPVSCCVLFYLLLGKNDWKFKLVMFSDVVFAFYAVFLPYRIISVYDIADAFNIFLLPVMVVMCLYIFRKASVFVAVIKAALWKKIVFGILATAVFLVVPALTETLYFLGYPLWVRCVVEVGTLLFAIGSFFLFRGEAAFSDVFPPEWKRTDEQVDGAGRKGKIKKSRSGRTVKTEKDSKVVEAAEQETVEPVPVVENTVVQEPVSADEKAEDTKKEPVKSEPSGEVEEKPVQKKSQSKGKGKKSSKKK